ncbi:MAG: MobC family plasmid mobilization relaxosome protein [Clostridia bacterium]|nr:MobC family plasmid mobilization relaxosome protein [Clostridia bacterium]MCI9085273.1 MobC family plasmid mobilization relaxosome protein [Clostridia bacterium]
MVKRKKHCNTAVYFRLDDKELAEIDRKAQALNLTRSEFIRQSTERERTVIIGRDELREVKAELRKIGINVNQIATLCNMGKIQNADLSETNEALNKIWEKIYELRKQVKRINEQDGDSSEI